MKRKMLILANRTLHNGPRMIREFETFRHNFEITAFGTSKPLSANIHFVNINSCLPAFYKVLNAVFRRFFFKGLTAKIAEYYPKIAAHILSNKYDVVIIHDPFFLPLISRLKKKSNFIAIYNAHEYHPLEFEDKKNWTETVGRYHYLLDQKYLSAIDLMVNVCDGIARKCETEFQKEPFVVPNVATKSDIKPFPNTGAIKLIYHGAIMQSRNIEAMIDVLKILGSNYTLDIMGVISTGNDAYLEELKTYAKKAGNVNFIPPVAFDEIVPKINGYDIGLFLLQPNNFNYTHALPNKLYEFIQAKLAIAIGPSVEMKKVVEKYNLGVVGNDFSAESLASKIKSLTRQDILMYKNNAIAASEVENAAHYSSIYLQKVLSMLN